MVIFCDVIEDTIVTMYIHVNIGKVVKNENFFFAC